MSEDKKEKTNRRWTDQVGGKRKGQHRKVGSTIHDVEIKWRERSPELILHGETTDGERKRERGSNARGTLVSLAATTEGGKGEEGRSFETDLG